MAYLLLAIAIVCEVAGTVALKLSDGFTRLMPSMAVAAGYGAAFVCLSLVLARGMPVGIVYGIWAAVGIALVAVIDALFLDESLTWMQIAGLALIVGGVLALEMGGTR